MYASVIKYILNPIFENDFIDVWEKQKAYLNSINAINLSYLHKENAITFIAYTQWKSKTDFDQFAQNPNGELRPFTDKIEQYCNSLSIQYRMQILNNN